LSGDKVLAKMSWLAWFPLTTDEKDKNDAGISYLGLLFENEHTFLFGKGESWLRNCLWGNFIL
jgi:hypothetical protein